MGHSNFWRDGIEAVLSNGPKCKCIWQIYSSSFMAHADRRMCYLLISGRCLLFSFKSGLSQEPHFNWRKPSITLLKCFTNWVIKIDIELRLAKPLVRKRICFKKRVRMREYICVHSLHDSANVIWVARKNRYLIYVALKRNSLPTSLSGFSNIYQLLILHFRSEANELEVQRDAAKTLSISG